MLNLNVTSWNIIKIILLKKVDVNGVIRDVVTLHFKRFHSDSNGFHPIA